MGFFQFLITPYGFIFTGFQEPCSEWWERFLRQVSCVSTGLTTDGDRSSTSLVILFDEYLFTLLSVLIIIYLYETNIFLK